MSKMSLLDKLGVLINLSIASKGYVIILGILLIFGIILSFTNKKNAKVHKMIYIIMTVVIAALLIATYHSSLSNMFNYMMNNFFIAVCFPTIAIYFAAIIAMNIIVWVSIFSFKSSKQIRTLNISIYVIMNYLLALLLKVINTKKLDIFDQASLYSNKDATALIELSALVFVVWIIFLILYKVILIYIRKDYKPTVKRIIVRKKVKKLPENFEPTEVPDYIYSSPHKETLVIDTKGKSEDEVMLERFTKQFTLEDYKYFSKLLREEQDRIAKKKVDFIELKNKEKVSKKKKKKEVVIEASNILEDDYREKQKQEIINLEEERRELLRKEQEKIVVSEVIDDKEREQKKLTELEMLYR